jgi:integrase
MAWVEDRWHTGKGRERRRSARYGKGARYRVGEKVARGIVFHGSYHEVGDAEQRKYEVERASQLGLPPDITPDRDMTLGWVLDSFRAEPVSVSRPSRRPSDGTVTTYISNATNIVDILGSDMRLSELTRLARTKLPHLARTLGERGYQPATVNAHLKLARTFYAMAAHYGKHPTMLPTPMVAPYMLDVPKLELRAFTPADIAALIAAAPERFRVFLMMAVFTGMRVGEVRGLRRPDVRLKEKVVHVRRQGGKTATTFIDLKTRDEGKRTIPLPSRLVSAIAEHLESTAKLRAKRRDLDLLFPTERGTVFQQANLTNREWTDTRRAAALAGLREATEGEYEPADLARAVHERREAARAEVRGEGKQIGAVIDAGHLAEYEAEADFLCELLDVEHPAVERRELFDEVDFHHLRRSYATNLFLETHDIGMVAALLGDNEQTVWKSYILTSAKDRDAQHAAAERLYDVDADFVTAEVMRHLLPDIADMHEREADRLEHEGRAIQAEVDELEGEVSALGAATERLSILQTDVQALDEFTAALKATGSLSKALARLTPAMRENPNIVQLVKARVDVEAYELAELARLQAKYA